MHILPGYEISYPGNFCLFSLSKNTITYYCNGLNNRRNKMYPDNTIQRSLLITFDAREEVIKFMDNHDLWGMGLKDLHMILLIFEGWLEWVEWMDVAESKYDKKGNCVYWKKTNGDWVRKNITIKGNAITTKIPKDTGRKWNTMKMEIAFITRILMVLAINASMTTKGT